MTHIFVFRWSFDSCWSINRSGCVDLILIFLFNALHCLLILVYMMMFCGCLSWSLLGTSFTYDYSSTTRRRRPKILKFLLLWLNDVDALNRIIFIASTTRSSGSHYLWSQLWSIWIVLMLIDVVISSQEAIGSLRQILKKSNIINLLELEMVKSL